MNDGIVVVMLVVVICFSTVVGSAFRSGSIDDDCQHYGKSHTDKYVLTCQEAGK